MSYNTPASFRTNSLCSGSFDDVPDGVVQYWLNVAQNVIDSSLASHFEGALPLASGSVPPMVLDMECTIAAYKVFASEGLNPNAPEAFGMVEQMYKETVGDGTNPASGLLGQLRYGRMKLLVAGDTGEVPKSQSVGVTGNPPRCWQQGRGRWVL